MNKYSTYTATAKRVTETATSIGKETYAVRKVGPKFAIENSSGELLDKDGKPSESVFYYRNQYLAEMALNNFEQSADILPKDIIGRDTELPVD